MGKSRLAQAFSVDSRLSVITTRNAPCPCGSGKRFKNYHGTARETGDEPPTGESLLRQARVAAAHGRFPEAEAHLARLLKIEPENVAAWNLLGECVKPRDA